VEQGDHHAGGGEHDQRLLERGKVEGSFHRGNLT
jgi:hypothetical protein